MNHFIRLPDTTEQGLCLVKWGERSSPSLVPLTRPHREKGAIGLIPAHTVTFGSLPQPGRYRRSKHQLSYVQRNLPADLLYDEERDSLLIWHSDKKQIIFIIVRQALLNHWLQLLNTSGPDLISLIPEWMLIPWHGQSGPALSVSFGECYLVRTSLWAGYSSPLKPDARSARILSLSTPSQGETINRQKMRSDALNTPRPRWLDHGLKRHHALQRCSTIICSILSGIIAFQAGYFLWDNARYNQLPSLPPASVIRPDIFTTHLQALGQASKRTPFIVQTMDYSHSVLEITLSSLRSCEEVHSALKANGSTVRPLKINEDKNHICEMTLEIAQ